MGEENKKPVEAKIGENSFELVLRILGNEFVAIKIGSTNFSEIGRASCRERV